ncbi:MAG: hypothetical protein ACI9TP_001168, partial [Candidatus Azotimanducaceae bacterium]
GSQLIRDAELYHGAQVFFIGGRGLHEH